MQPVSRVLGNQSLITDQAGGVTPVLDPLYGVLNQASAESLLSLREPATVLSNNYSQAGNISLPIAWGSPSGMCLSPNGTTPLYKHPSAYISSGVTFT